MKLTCEVEDFLLLDRNVKLECKKTGKIIFDSTESIDKNWEDALSLPSKDFVLAAIYVGYEDKINAVLLLKSSCNKELQIVGSFDSDSSFIPAPRTYIMDCPFEENIKDGCVFLGDLLEGK